MGLIVFDYLKLLIHRMKGQNADYLLPLTGLISDKLEHNQLIINQYKYPFHANN